MSISYDEEIKKEDDKYYFKQSLSESINIPIDGDESTMKAKYKNGKLRLKMNKKCDH